ncbi:hypothetical protein BZG05_13015 [Salinivibrio kushneri]|uniref:hypothetical protein n=1 Tax=Salinivibrio kushneri TaxID=1908198 RepID=UPI000988CB31|nr:hypothetical protein [Salinivibrio kushneri]OOE32878.1 hypothetical protein BZG05_13015 [Salinivibrio kushneri]
MKNTLYTNKRTEQTETGRKENLGVIEGVATGMDALSWMTRYDIEQADKQGYSAERDLNFDPKNHERAKEAREKIQDPDTYQAVLESSNAAEFEYNLDKALFRQEAQEKLAKSEHPMAYGLAGAMLSPETFIPVSGQLGKLAKPVDLIKFAAHGRKAKAAVAAKDAAKAGLGAGAIGALRAESDASYTKYDAAMDAAVVGGASLVMGGASAFLKNKKGVKLAKEQRQLSRAAFAQKETQSAKTAMDVLEGKLTDNRLKATETRAAQETAKHTAVSDLSSRSTAQLREKASKKLKRSEYRDLYRQIDQMEPSDQAKIIKQSRDNVTARQAVDALYNGRKAKLQQHLEALEAENVLFNRTNGLPDDLKPEEIPSFRKNQVQQSIEQSHSLLSRRAMLAQASNPEARAAIYDSYIKQLDDSYASMVDVYKRSGGTVAKNEEMLSKMRKEVTKTVDAEQRGFKYALDGLKQGKVTPMVNSTLGWVNDYQRQLRSSNSEYRKLISELLQSSVDGGRSVASVAENNYHDLVRHLDKWSAKSFRKMGKDFKKTNPNDDVFEYISDMVEGYKVPRAEHEKAVRDAYRDFFKETLERVKTYNPNYTTQSEGTYFARYLDRDAIYRLRGEGKQVAVIKALEKGIRKAQYRELAEAYGDELAEKLVKKGAEGYWKKLERLLKATELDSSKMEDDQLIKHLIDDGDKLNDLTPEEILDELDEETLGRLVGDKVPNGNRPDRFKTRLKLNLDVEADGVQLKQLFNRNAPDVAQRYAREMAAWMGFAEKGFYTPDDLLKSVEKVRKSGVDNKTAMKEAEKAMQYIGMVKGVPTFKDSTLNSLAQGMMATEYVLRMGIAPVMALFESGRTTAMMMSDAFRNMPFVSTMARDIHKKLSHEEAVELGDDLSALMQHRHQPSIYFSSRADVQEDTSARKFVKYSRELSDRWSRVNFMEQIDRNVRSMALNTAHQRLIKHLTQNKDLGKLIDLDYIGLDFDMKQAIKSEMKRTVKKHKGIAGDFYTVDFDKWDKYTLLRYKEALNQAERRMVQKSYMGESTGERLPPIARIFLQFRGFGLTAIGKQFTADVAQAEKQGLTGYGELASSWLTMGIFTQLGLETRSRLANAGREDYEQKVTEQTTGANGWANWLRYHPSLGFTRDLMDVTIGSKLVRNLIGEDEYEMRFGKVYRSTGYSNQGFLESTPVGSTLSELKGVLEDPESFDPSYFMPDAAITRFLNNIATK